MFWKAIGSSILNRVSFYEHNSWMDDRDREAEELIVLLRLIAKGIESLKRNRCWWPVGNNNKWGSAKREEREILEKVDSSLITATGQRHVHESSLLLLANDNDDGQKSQSRATEIRLNRNYARHLVFIHCGSAKEEKMGIESDILGISLLFISTGFGRGTLSTESEMNFCNKHLADQEE